MLSRAARVAEQLRRAGAAQAAGMSTVAAAVAAGGAARRLAFIGVPGLGLGTFAAVTDEPQRVAYNAAMVPVRLGRNVATATTMVAGASCRRGVHGNWNRAVGLWGSLACLRRRWRQRAVHILYIF